ncbi:MAG TPA: GNAT family N-acetyltransferase [Burkholderiales bacterium]|nr:GNAT family N-acetyltransferase [Burkholderiales bacterium]
MKSSAAGSIALELAAEADALGVARMSRDFIETGLGWSWTAARVLRAIRDPEAVVLVAREGRSLVGFAIMDFGDEAAHLALIAVDPTHRRRRVGTSLFEWLKASALTAGIAVIKLELRAGNVEAQHFYRCLGFEEIGWTAGYYRRRETALRMALKLRRSAAGTPHSPH